MSNIETATIENLQERVNRMLNGEQKRREIAVKWLEEIEAILTLEFCEQLFGTDPLWQHTTIKDDLVYRYEDDSVVGFSYFSDCYEYSDYLTNIKDNNFWDSIAKIIDWIPKLVQVMDSAENRRDRLLSKIRVSNP